MAEVDNVSNSQGHLASIPDRKTHDFLKGLGQSLGEVMWIGGYWNENGWHWSDGTPWHYQSWIPGEPNNPNQKCVTIFLRNNTRWDDESCRWSRSFFCQLGELIFVIFKLNYFFNLHQISGVHLAGSPMLTAVIRCL